MTDRNRKTDFDLDDNQDKTNILSNEGTRERIKEEVDKLAQKGPITQNDIIDLYNKYPNNDFIVEEIIKLTTKRYQKIKEKAREIAQKISKKYHNSNRPLHEILEKMLKYKSANKWSTSEYEEFRKELSSMLSGKRAMEIDYNQNIVTNRSRINRALGSTATIKMSGLNIKETEYPIVNEIMAMHNKSVTLHKTLYMHSLMYQDCSIVAMTGEYKRDNHTATNYIHPLIACMFLPKFEIFEMMMLYSNFGNIIKSCYDKKPIVTEPDSLLYQHITTDPNDVVCEINSPMADLRNRYRVQIALWETVLKIRNGKYYDNSSFNEFVSALNSCRNNLYDNADLVYNQDEGAMLRRLLSVFSLRPTIITTRPIYSLMSMAASPYSNFSLNMNNPMAVSPFNNQPVYTITYIPMITVQIPPYVEGSNPEAQDLRISQNIWINENKTIVPKEQSVIYSKEVLIFYVNRRIQRIQLRTFTNPLHFSQTPLTMTNFERLNSYPVTVPPTITLGRSGEIYNLRSVVTVTESEILQSNHRTQIITGNAGLIMKHRDLNSGEFNPVYYLYDPIGASIPVPKPDETGEYILNKPISIIDPYYSIENNQSFFSRASRNGTIFIYANPSGYNPQEIVAV